MYLQQSFHKLNTVATASNIYFSANQHISNMAPQAASLRSQCILYQTPQSPPPETTNHRSLCSFYQAAPTLALVSDVGLHQSPSQEHSDPTDPMPDFILHQSTTQSAPQLTNPKGGFGWRQGPIKVTSSVWVSFCTATHYCNHGQPSQAVSIRVNPTTTIG